MEVNTPIAEDIYATDQSAQYDAACKRLLSERIILAWIMKECLDEYRDCDVWEIATRYIESEPEVSKVFVAPDETNAPARIRGLRDEDTSLTEGKVTYDVRFLALSPSSGGELRLIIINVEAQYDMYPGYPVMKRAVFYAGRMLSAQYGTEFTNSQYQNVKKVVSIWVCLNPPKARRNSITRYRLMEENLVGEVHEPFENYDLIGIVMICLGGPEAGNYDGVLKLLDVLLSSEVPAAERRRILQNDFDIPMTQKLETEVQAMCNLSQGVMQKGYDKGYDNGYDNGVEKGKLECLLDSIRSLIASMGWTVEQAMDALRLTEDDREKCTTLLRQPGSPA